MPNTQFIALLFRLILGFVYLSAGLSKLGAHSFGNIIGPVESEKVLALAGVAAYWGDLLAFVQILTGALLLTHRLRLAGAVAALPLSTGLFLFTLHWQGTMYINAFFLLMTIVLLLIEWRGIRKGNSGRFLNVVSSIMGRKAGSRDFTFYILGLAVLAFIAGLLLPEHKHLFVVITTILMAFILIDLAQAHKYLILDKGVLVCYAVFILIVSYLPLLVNNGAQFRTVFLPILGILLLLGGLIFVWRLLRFRKRGSSDLGI